MRTLATLILSSLLGAPSLGTQTPSFEVSAPPAPEVTTADIVEPLADLIGAAESDNVGGYDAANNGRAMDLGRDGLTRYFGRPASEVTVGEILLAQSRRQLHAVGRYQIIGSTMDEIVRLRCIDGRDLFTNKTQDQAFLCLIKAKRPSVWRFIVTGQGVNRAANALAKEWASMPWTDGRTYYGRGDRAHATRGQVLKVLSRVRRNAQATPEAL